MHAGLLFTLTRQMEGNSFDFLLQMFRNQRFQQLHTLFHFLFCCETIQYGVICRRLLSNVCQPQSLSTQDSRKVVVTQTFLTHNVQLSLDF